METWFSTVDLTTDRYGQLILMVLQSEMVWFFKQMEIWCCTVTMVELFGHLARIKQRLIDSFYKTMETLLAMENTALCIGLLILMANVKFDC